MARKRLKSATDLRRFMAGLINRVELGEIELEKASKLGYLASILLRVIENSDMERRIEELEQRYEKLQEQNQADGVYDPSEKVL